MALRELVWIALSVAAAPLAAVERQEIRFGDDLGLADLRLSGPRATRQVEFAWPRDWRPQPGAVLRLRFRHSPALDGERSFLAVSLNHGVLRSLRLEPETPGELTVPLPPASLREENQLVLAVEQFVSTGVDEGPWTLVSSESTLVIPFERQSVEWSLADLPEPILRRRGYAARELTVLVPLRPSRETLEATARSLAGLAAALAPAPVRLAFSPTLEEAATPVLVVGTPGEQRSLRTLGDLGAGTSEAGATTGIVALLPRAAPKAQPVLVVTGREPSAVGHAALALFSARRAGSRVLLAPSAPARRVGGLREWRRFIPPASGFSIDESGDPRPELAVTADLPARVRLKAPPDARFLPWGHRASLVFEALPGLASDSRAALEVYWNDVLLRQVSMEPRARGRGFTVSAPIPASALQPENVLTVAWNGRSGAPGPFVALRGESSFSLPREYVAELPDLALLRQGFYPFGLRADLSDTVVGVPPGEEAFPALCELALVMGRLAPADQFRFRLTEPAVAAASDGVDAILLEVGEAPGSPPPPDLKRLPRGETLGRLPFVQELESPRGGGRYVLRVRAPTPALLRAALRGLGEPAILNRLSGDTAFLAAEGPLCFRLVARRTVAEISHLARLEAWVRGHWVALPAILAGVSGVLFVGLRLVLGRYRAARTA